MYLNRVVQRSTLRIATVVVRSSVSGLVVGSALACSQRTTFTPPAPGPNQPDAQVVRPVEAGSHASTSTERDASSGTGSSSLLDSLLDAGPDAGPSGRAQHATALVELNDGPCRSDAAYRQEDLREPTRIEPVNGQLATELVIRLRERCVPVWTGQTWEMQTLRLRTYGFPRDPSQPITTQSADDPDSPAIAWSSPGPTFVMHPASSPGLDDGTRFKMRLYNRMPYEADPLACIPNLKCNTKGPNAGVNPETGQCWVTPTLDAGGVPPEVPSQLVDGQVVEPPNCFHGVNSTNFHFHGLHVSPQLGQDFVGLELRPPAPEDAGVDVPSAHGEHGSVAYGQFDYALDPLRYTQAPGTHWYHAHKHGSTALQVLNGQVGALHVEGEFDRRINEYYRDHGGGVLEDRLIMVQQIAERQPGLGGGEPAQLLVNGQANPIVRMKRREIQRWRFVGATMQTSAAVNIGFSDRNASDAPLPVVKQIAMDGVQFSPDNYECQPFLGNPNCSSPQDTTAFEESTDFALHPGNRVDVLVQAPDAAGTYCVLQAQAKQNSGSGGNSAGDAGTADAGASDAGADASVSTGPSPNNGGGGGGQGGGQGNGQGDGQAALDAARRQVAAAAVGLCGDTGGIPPLFTLVVENDEREMHFPSRAEFPTSPGYLDAISEAVAQVTPRAIHYQMVNTADLPGSQFWIDQTKYDPTCANETLTIDVPEQWTLWNNSTVPHPFHIHQNPFQLLADDRGTYQHPVWRDTLALSTAKTNQAPNSEPSVNGWGKSVINIVAKEFTGAFVNHCHILGHEDRGMMHNTQASCPNGDWGVTGPVVDADACDAQGFCPSDCVSGTVIPASPQCAPPPVQTSDWPEAYGYSSP